MSKTKPPEAEEPLQPQEKASPPQEPPATSADPSTHPPADPTAGQTATPRRRRRRESSLQLGDNLGSMASVLEAKKAELKEQNAQDENRVYTVNPEVHIADERFQKALMSYADELEANNRMNLASILREGETELYHNQWTFTLKDDLHKDLIVREAGLVPYLRKQLETPDLFVEFRVSENLDQKELERPYTDDQKLREMSKKNPSLEKLQEIFKTRIIY